MTDRITAGLLEALQAEGIPAYPEYPQILKPLPADPFFVTAACTEASGGAPLESLFGDAVTVMLTLRLRLHCKTDTDPEEYSARTMRCILHVLETDHSDLRGMQQGALRYDRQLDRLVCEVQLRIGGTVYLGGGDAE